MNGVPESASAMRRMFLRSLKWIILLLAALATEKAIDSFYPGIETHQAIPWKYAISPNFGLAVFSLICLFLLMFRYFTSSVFQLYEACYDHTKLDIPGDDFSKDNSIMGRIQIRHLLSMGFFLFPQFFLTYLGALSLQYIRAYFFWLFFLPFVDVLVFSLTYGLLRLKAWYKLFKKKREYLKEFEKLGRETLNEIKKLSREIDPQAAGTEQEQKMLGRIRKAKSEFEAEVINYNEVFKDPFFRKEGPRFFRWDALDFLSIGVFFVFLGISAAVSCGCLPEQYHNKVELIGASLSMLAIISISLWNIHHNWSYYKLYLLFLLHA